jgi:hypothetical protein
MINVELRHRLGLDHNGRYSDQLRRAGFEDLGEATGWEKTDPRWARVENAEELYYHNGYRLHVDPDAMLMFYTQAD